MFKAFSRLTFVIILLSTPFVYGETSPIQVVTSFSILEDITKELGGEYVEVTNLVARNADAHMYRPIPSDAVAIAKSDLVIFNGLAFEGWISRLLENNGRETVQVTASKGVEPMSVDGETDPHAWQSFKNIRIYIDNISEALIALQPKHKQDLLSLKKAYLEKINTLDTELSTKLEATPKDKRIVVTSHDAFGYLGQEFDIQFFAPLGMNLEIEASAADVAEVIDQIREQNVQALFVENINDPRLLKRISTDTKVAIGGSLYSDALSEIDGEAPTYLAMMTHNIEALVKAFEEH